MTAPEARCPRCGTPLHADQEWCLQCGAAARTAIAPTPNWRLPIALVAVVVLLSGVALAFAFTRLADRDDDLAAATQTAPTIVETVTQATPAPTTATTPPATQTTPPPVPPAP